MRSALLDANRNRFVLVGVQMGGLEAAARTAADQKLVDSMTTLTFRIIRQRWNMNSVRLLVSPWIWKRDGRGYFDQVAQVVKRANDEGLVVVLVPADDQKAGAAFNTGLPGPEVADFLADEAAYFKSNQMLVFDLYGRPSADLISGHVAGVRRAADWEMWRNGGTASNGRPVVGMQQLVERIRAAGAAQLIAAPAFHDTLDFQGFNAGFYLKDPDILYEVHPYFDHAATDEQRAANFGFLNADLPVYAGEWGVPLQEDSASCRSFPADPVQASATLAQLFNYFVRFNISWSATAFEPGQLIGDLQNYTATVLDRPWTCGAVLVPQPGIGAELLLSLTGDQFGFGSIAADQVGNTASKQVGAMAPGELITIYGQYIGPEVTVTGRVDSGRLTTQVAETEVLFDGVPAPVLAADYFQVTVQVPYEVARAATTTLQLIYRGVPSNKLLLPVSDAFPQLFTTEGADVLAVNQDGTKSNSGTPSPAGSIVVLYASGAGELLPGGVTGRIAAAPYGRPVLPVSLSIGGIDAELLYAGEAPGLAGGAAN